MAYGLHSNNRADYMFLSRLGVDMHGLFPQRFIALLEQMLTDGMDKEQVEAWNIQMRETVLDVDIDDPQLRELVDLRQAVDVYAAADLLRLGDQLFNATQAEDSARVSAISEQMSAIRAEAMEAAAAT